MTDLDIEYTSIFTEMEKFLQLKARKQQATTPSIFLRCQYKSGLRVIDHDKRQFTVDQTYMSSFRSVYTDKAYKAVRLQNWEFQLNFVGKKCQRITLISNFAVFIASKSTKNQMDGCLFKFNVLEGQAEIQKLSPQVIGYLNRIGKRNLCAQSYNVHSQMKSLLSFIKFSYHANPSFNYTPWVRSQSSKVETLSTLNPDGKKVLQKLRHFITRQQISEFLIHFEASQENTEVLKKIVAGSQN